MRHALLAAADLEQLAILLHAPLVLQAKSQGHRTRAGSIRLGATRVQELKIVESEYTASGFWVKGLNLRVQV